MNTMKTNASAPDTRSGADPLDRWQHNTDAKLSELKSNDVQGGLPELIYAPLRPPTSWLA